MSDWTELKFNLDMPVSVTLQSWGDGNLIKLDNYENPQYFVGDKTKFRASEGLKNLLTAKGVKAGDTITIEKKSSEKSKYGIFHVDGQDLDSLNNSGGQPQQPVVQQPVQTTPVNTPVNNGGVVQNGGSPVTIAQKCDATIQLCKQMIADLEWIKKEASLPF
tara:strand:+ start:480 stop:965 length:486 start_codon:yes stop_codon:yes gene_type:complete